MKLLETFYNKYLNENIISESGTTKVEYSLLLSLLLMIIIPATSVVGMESRTTFKCLGSAFRGNGQCAPEASHGDSTGVHPSAQPAGGGSGEPAVGDEGGKGETSNPGHAPSDSPVMTM